MTALKSHFDVQKKLDQENMLSGSVETQQVNRPSELPEQSSKFTLELKKDKKEDKVKSFKERQYE